LFSRVFRAIDRTALAPAPGSPNPSGPVTSSPSQPPARCPGAAEFLVKGETGSVPVATASGSGRGAEKSGRASTAPWMSCGDAFASIPMVRLGVECRASVWHVLIEAPDATRFEM
jgi:hypothetical protein